MAPTHEEFCLSDVRMVLPFFCGGFHSVLRTWVFAAGEVKVSGSLAIPGLCKGAPATPGEEKILLTPVALRGR